MATQADPRDIILAPVISEKSYGLIEDNVYTFLVHPDSNKTQIKICLLYTSPSPRDATLSRMPSSA